MSLWTERNWSPMLLKEIEKPFNSKDYIFEIKFDGIRACVFVGPNHFEIRSRNKQDITYLYPELKSIQSFIKKNTILDGEIVVMENGKPSFSKLQERSHLKDKNKIQAQVNKNSVIFVCFDILYCGKDLTDLNLLDRKKLLDKFADGEYFIKSKIFKNEGVKLFENIKKHNLEGIVAKKTDSKYLINTRGDAWVKIKNKKEGIFLIGGYEIKKRDYISVLLGELRNDKLFFVGKVSVTKNLPIYDEILKSRKSKNVFYDYKSKDANYIVPNIKCEIIYQERTKGNKLRQPVIKRKVGEKI